MLVPVSSRRSYNQLCGLARTLDIVGERWTLLVVRDLSLGPRRYTDLVDGLPGISEALLTQRLRHLESEGLVERTFSSEQHAVVYRLTPSGLALGAALVPLASWGLEHLELDDDVDARADHVAVALRSRLDAAAFPDVTERYEMVVDEERFVVEVDRGAVNVVRGGADDAAAEVRTDLATFQGIGMGTVSIGDAIANGRLTATGDPEALSRYAAMVRRPRARA